MDTIVLCVDRDDDIGRHTGVRGPIVGVERNLRIAQRLALTDPADTDVNALYGALKLARDQGMEIATLTGDKNVGLVSDKKISKQLDKLIKEHNPKNVIIVTDGLDDEQVIPIIQSRVKIISVKTIVVRQSKELEKAYFKLTHFLKEISEEPDLARLIFGLPGIALMLLAIGGENAYRLLMAVFGVYLIIRGFGWEESLFQKASDFIRSLSVDRISTVIYFVSLITLLIGGGYALSDLSSYPLILSDFDAAITSFSRLFLNSVSVDILILSMLIAVIGRLVDEYSTKHFIQVRRYLIFIGFILVINIIVDAGAKYLVLEGYSLGNFISTCIIYVLLFGLWSKLTEYFFPEQIAVIEDLIKKTRGTTVYTSEGKQLGKVGGVYIDDLEIAGIRVGRRYIKAEDILSFEDVITVDAQTIK